MEYSVDKGLYLIETLFKTSHVVCRLPLYTKYETLGIPAYNSGMYVFKEVTKRQNLLPSSIVKMYQIPKEL
jgi:hypothetical protein